MNLSALEELEDGSANLEIDISPEERDVIMEAGINLVIACGISGIKLHDAYQLIIDHGQANEVVE